MAVVTSCPDPVELRLLIEGALSGERQTDVTEHLDSCPTCQKALEQLAAGNSSSWPSAVRTPPPQEPPPESAYWNALRKLQEQTVALRSPGVPPMKDDTPLEFLRPTDRPGFLGRISHFDVSEVIGQGGMGIVLKAFDACLQRYVAIKVLHPMVANNELARKRFCREARAAASISHEHVVAIHQVEQEEGSDLPFLVMQMVPGESLQDRLDRGGPLELKDVLDIGRQTAAGLAAAHHKGLVHRDIKPANILLEDGRRVRLTDFGLARAYDDVKLTQTGFVAGTPMYMAPEQAHGGEVDHRADLFSLGSVLYAMCTGRAPFDGSTPYVVLKQVTEEHPRPIRDLNPKIPVWLCDIIERLHAKDPADRIQTADEVADVLGHYLPQVQTGMQVQHPCPGTRTKEALYHLSRWARRRTGALALVAFLVAGAAVAGAFFGGPILSGWFQRADPVTPPRAILNVGTGPIWDVVYSPDGHTLAVAIDNGTVKLWDAREGRVKATINAHKGAVWTVAFSPDGKTLATGSSDMTVKLWDVDTGEEKSVLKHSGAIRALAYSGDGKRLASGGRNGMVTIWDLETHQEHATTQPHAGEVVTVAFSHDGTTVASAGGDEAIKLWDAVRGRELQSLQGHRGGVYSVAFSLDGKTLASGGWDHTLRLWDVASGTNVKSFQGHTQDIWGVAFAPDGKTVATASEDRTVKLWDVSNGEAASFTGHTGTLYTVTYSPDGAVVASGGRDGVVRLWDVPRR